jgi:hypothetical protein
MITRVLLPSPAEKVEVQAPIAFAWHNNEALFAASAPDHAFEVVVVVTLAGTAAAVRVHDPLHSVKQVFGDKWLMPSLVLNALVEQLANVVAVPEHVIEGLLANRVVPTGCRESGISHHRVELFGCVSARCHEFK